MSGSTGGAAEAADLEPEFPEPELPQPEFPQPEFVVVDEIDRGRFELSRDGELVGFADYRQADGAVIVPHVETLAIHRGNGFGARLMDGLLDIIRADGRRIVPLCPFAAQHIADDERFHDLLKQD